MHSRFSESDHSFHLGPPIVGTLAAALAVSACTIPGDQPAEPVAPPTIVGDAVVPPVDVPLASWPADNQFVVPVQVGDPRQPFQWAVFIDSDVATSEAPFILGTQHAPDGGLSLIAFPLTAPVAAQPCPHHITFAVANSFSSSFTSKDLNTGNSVTWTYAPETGCPSQDDASSSLDSSP